MTVAASSSSLSSLPHPLGGGGGGGNLSSTRPDSHFWYGSVVSLERWCSPQTFFGRLAKVCCTRVTSLLQVLSQVGAKEIWTHLYIFSSTHRHTHKSHESHVSKCWVCHSTSGMSRREQRWYVWSGTKIVQADDRENKSSRVSQQPNRFVSLSLSLSLSLKACVNCALKTLKPWAMRGKSNVQGNIRMREKRSKFRGMQIP